MSEVISHSIDAKVWAVEFMNLFGEKREVIDEGLMIAWFANAIMNGFDEATRREQKRLDRAKAALEELFAMVNGECPSLLNEDSGGNARLYIEIEQVLKEMA